MCHLDFQVQGWTVDYIQLQTNGNGVTYLGRYNHTYVYIEYAQSLAS